MSEDAWPHRAATDEDTQPQNPLNGAGVTEDVAQAQPTPDTQPGRLPQEPAPPPEVTAGLARSEATASSPSSSHEAPVGESPDLLRWRAEMLLDEMMVGAVDASAGDVGGGYRPLSFMEMETRPPVAARQESLHLSGEPAASDATARPARPSRAPRPIIPGNAPDAPAQAPTSQGSSYLNQNGSGAHSGEAAANGSPLKSAVNGSYGAGSPANGAHSQGAPEREPGSVSQPSAPAPIPPYYPAAVSRVIPVTATPQPSASPSSAPAESPNAPRRLGGRAPETPEPKNGRTASGERHPYDDEPPRKLVAVEERYPRSSERRSESATSLGANGRHADDLIPDDPFTPGLGPVRRNPAVARNDQTAGAMSVGAMVSRYTSKYAHLLPRSTPWDEHEMEREIAALADEMARVLPSGHESSRRARHLLEKAQTIFASDPMRSAEVDYYLSQVRAIVQRSRQTVHWSGLYRKQLVLYHTAWLALSGMVAAVGVLYGAGVASVLGGWFGWAEGGFLSRSLAPALVTIFSGSFGGALGGLLNLRRYQRRELGYVDRKYSLRGLILPVMGLLIGLVFFGLVAGALALLGFAEPWPVWLLSASALLAFLLGLVQESIYGTRE